MDQILLSQKPFYVDTNVFVPCLSWSVGHSVIRIRLKVISLIFLWCFRREKRFSASLWGYLTAWRALGQLWWGCHIFNHNHLTSPPGHSVCPGLWKCVSDTSHVTHPPPPKKSSYFPAALGFGVGIRVSSNHRLLRPLLSLPAHYLFSLCLSWTKATTKRLQPGPPPFRWSSWLASLALFPQRQRKGCSPCPLVPASRHTWDVSISLVSC